MMNSTTKTLPKDWKCIVDAETISRSISRMSYEILEKNQNLKNLAIVGIRTGGEFLAQRLKASIKKIANIEAQYGVIDITLYRDDLSNADLQPTIKGTELDFPISGSRIILVDDVLYTGRTIRAALDAIIDFGRPACVELAVLVDRGHRELPIRPDYVGKNLPTSQGQFLRVRLSEQGFPDGVYVMEKK